MKIKEVLKLLKNDGWIKLIQKGSHQQFKHPLKKGLVTVAGKDNADLHPATLNSILKQSQLNKK